MTPQELAADLRSRINPLYADQLGTESYERRICAEAIEALVQERDAMRAEKILHDQAWCDEAERTIKQLQIALKIKAEEHTCCSEDLIKLKHGANKLAAENKTLRDAWSAEPVGYISEHEKDSAWISSAICHQKCIQPRSTQGINHEPLR